MGSFPSGLDPAVARFLRSATVKHRALELSFLLALVGVAAHAAPAEPATTVLIPLQLTELDGGRLELDGGVPIDHALQFELPGRVDDLRLRIVDGNGHLVAAREHLKLTERTTVRFAPDSPLLPATSYHAIAEPETADALKDAHGALLTIPEFAFRTAGDPLPARPARGSHRWRTRHRR
jgi:hypothetical protein